MDGRRSLNVHAPVFVPGQLWPGVRQITTSPTQPLITYSDMGKFDLRVANVPVGEGEEQLKRSLESRKSRKIDFYALRLQAAERNGARQQRSIVDADQALQRLQELVKNRQNVFPYVDNTYAAVEARQMFQHYFGSDPTKLQAWQDLCFFCGCQTNNIPRSIGQCKKWLQKIYVNVFDLVDAVRSYRVVEPWFEDADDLRVYSRQMGKICPSEASHGNDFFRFLLKKWQ